MISQNDLELIDFLFRKATGINKYFGGKLVLIFGDIFQLPPVTTKNKEPYYFFESQIFRSDYFTLKFKIE